MNPTGKKHAFDVMQSKRKKDARYIEKKKNFKNNEFEMVSFLNLIYIQVVVIICLLLFVHHTVVLYSIPPLLLTRQGAIVSNTRVLSVLSYHL